MRGRCDNEAELGDDSPSQKESPKPLRVADLSEDARTDATRDNKRRARDSNPQPVSRHLISSEAANQFAYPPLRREYPRPGLTNLPVCTATGSIAPVLHFIGVTFNWKDRRELAGVDTCIATRDGKEYPSYL